MRSGRSLMMNEHAEPMGGEPREFAVEVAEGEPTVVRIRGEVDLYTAPRLRERLDDVVSGQDQQVVVDLTDMDFIDSTGLGVLVGALKQVRERGGDMVLRNASRSTHKILEIAGLTKLFTVE